MTRFKMQERDLDLLILEELYSDSGFSVWLTETLGLDGFGFAEAKHSVLDEVNKKWGETDVLAFFSNNSEKVALLIEDKIDAHFTDRQAHRYHERAKEIVRAGEAVRYITLLIAPRAYLAGVPTDDCWDHKLPIEALRDWFAALDHSHARWRAAMLDDCLTRLHSTRAPKSGDVIRFGAELSTYLAHHHAPTLSHKPGKDSAGPTIRFPGDSPSKALWWKVKKNQMTMQLMDSMAGHIAHMEVPEGIGRETAIEFNRKCDYLTIEVPPVDFSIPLEMQKDVVEAAMAAAYRLIAFLPKISAKLD